MIPEQGRGRNAAALFGLALGATALAACGTGGQGPVASGAAGALMGQTASQIQGSLGTPELRRAEGRGELWQYRSDSCVFDVFLYEGRVVHTEARARTATAGGRDTVDASTCLGTVRRA